MTGLYLPPSSDFDLDVQPILDAHCVQCHQAGTASFPEHGLDLSSGSAYRSLVGVPSRARPDLPLVARYTSDWSRSYLWQKVGCAELSSGHRMPPPPAPAMHHSDRMLIEGWIMRGAAPGVGGDGRELPIQFGLGGSWYDSSASGQGLMFEAIPGDPPRFALIWATFAEGPALAGEFDPTRARWLIGVGSYAEGESEVEMELRYSTRGGFDAYNQRAESQVVGFARLQFHSCTESTLFYDIQLDANPELPRQRHVSLRRLTPNVLCEEADPGVGR